MVALGISTADSALLALALRVPEAVGPSAAPPSISEVHARSDAKPKDDDHTQHDQKTDQQQLRTTQLMHLFASLFARTSDSALYTCCTTSSNVARVAKSSWRPTRIDATDT